MTYEFKKHCYHTCTVTTCICVPLAKQLEEDVDDAPRHIYVCHLRNATRGTHTFLAAPSQLSSTFHSPPPAEISASRRPICTLPGLAETDGPSHSPGHADLEPMWTDVHVPDLDTERSDHSPDLAVSMHASSVVDRPLWSLKPREPARACVHPCIHRGHWSLCVTGGHSRRELPRLSCLRRERWVHLTVPRQPSLLRASCLYCIVLYTAAERTFFSLSLCFFYRSKTETQRK